MGKFPYMQRLHLVISEEELTGLNLSALVRFFNDSLSELTQALHCLRRVSQTESGLGWIYPGSEMNQGALMHGLHSYQKGHIIFAYLEESIHN